jgi:hypothetical protein
VTSKHIKLTITLCTAQRTGWNLSSIDPLFSVDDITVIAKNESEENAIIFALTEIACLDNLSLEGDIPHDD